jgi:hypothetical protein
MGQHHPRVVSDGPNTTHVSGWFVISNLFQATRETANPTNDSWWFVHLRPKSKRGHESIHQLTLVGLVRVSALLCR